MDELLAQAAAEPSAAPSVGIGALLSLVLFIAASVWLGAVAQRVVQRSRFIQGYFQGNRGLGAWTIALTATVQSGGTFMGFPSLVYSSGWIVALWIGSYMVVPITGFAVIGKRVAQISRRTGAVTMPDLFRARYASPAAGLVTSLLIIAFLSIMMIAQFKAGAVVMKIAWPGAGSLALADDAQAGVDVVYLIGLAAFTMTVVGYTLIGGFLAAVWTDLLQSVMMFFGVMILVVLALWATGGLEKASRQAVQNVEQVALARGKSPSEASFIASQYVSGPGLKGDGTEYLPLAMAFSFFCFWPFGGMASPASVVRIMACKDTAVLRKSIFLLAVYNMCIYLPLIVVCICARAMIPDLKQTDEVIPRKALALTGDLRVGPVHYGSWISGLILAAPFGAIMATVSCYLLVIASGLVRDVYQRFLHPQATEHELRRLTYFTMAIVGGVAAALNISPVEKLQMLVVFSTSCAASSFLMPTLMMCYWRRATAAGTISAMLAGASCALALNLTGLGLAYANTGQFAKFTPYALYGFEPLIWGLLVSLVVGLVVSLLTRPPDEALVSKLFDAPEAA
jgi:sodium/pantothenate symporter